MSDSQAYEELAVASDGVSVIKRFEEDEFPVPAIAFEFTSHREEEVHVVLSDTVPDEIEVEDLGFHPEYGSEYWVIDDDNNIAFERDLGAEETYTTVYGIRATGSDNVEQFLTEPTLEEVDPPLPDDADAPENLIPESEDDVVKEAITGDGEIPGLEEDGEGDDEDVEKLDLKDPNEPADARTADSTDGAASSGTSVAAVDGSVVATMAEEIRQQNVSAEDVKLLRQAFEMAGRNGGTTAAKVDQLQDDIADLRAYTNALEEFLGDNGTAQQVLDDLEGRIESFESQLSSLQSSLDANSDQLESVAATVGGFDEDIQSLSEDVDSVSEELDAVTGEVGTLSDDVGEATDRVDAMDDQFAEFEESLEGVQSDVAELEENVADGEVAGRVDEIEGEISDLQTWQEQIKETFGG